LLTWGAPLIAREAVPTPTPAASATSMIVGLFSIIFQHYSAMEAMEDRTTGNEHIYRDFQVWK
jgi:hypothetical protein